MCAPHFFCVFANNARSNRLSIENVANCGLIWIRLESNFRIELGKLLIEFSIGLHSSKQVLKGGPDEDIEWSVV